MKVTAQARLCENMIKAVLLSVKKTYVRLHVAYSAATLCDESRTPRGYGATREAVADLDEVRRRGQRQRRSFVTTDERREPERLACTSPMRE